MAHLAVEDHFLIKAPRIEKGWAVDRIIAEFPATATVENRLNANFVYITNLP